MRSMSVTEAVEVAKIALGGTIHHSCKTGESDCGQCGVKIAALAALSGVRLVAVEAAPEGVPEVISIGRSFSHVAGVHQISATWTEKPFWGPMCPDVWLRYRYSGIVNAAKEAGDVSQD